MSHREKNYECDICGKKTKKKSILRYHMISHAKIQPKTKLKKSVETNNKMIQELTLMRRNVRHIINQSKVPIQKQKQLCVPKLTNKNKLNCNIIPDVVQKKIDHYSKVTSALNELNDAMVKIDKQNKLNKKTIKIFDMSEPELDAFYQKHKIVFENEFNQYLKNKKVTSHPVGLKYLHLISDDTCRKMFDVLQINLGRKNDGGQHTVVFSDYFVPMFTTLLYMDIYHKSESDAIRDIQNSKFQCPTDYLI